MRKLCLIYLALLVFVCSCNTTKTSKSGDAEKQFVATFISYMNHDQGPKQAEMKACISPAYIKEKGIDINKYKVNNYSVWGSSIEYYVAADAMVITKVWGENKSWIHQLEFKVVKESGKLYLMPSKHSDTYIDPWYVVKLRIK